jgi:peptidoglycan/LPS O-acetylase OafA/YrhL
MTLDQVTKNRDNNFNLIRILAAVAVLVSHAWIIAKLEAYEGALRALMQQVAR